MRVIAGRARSLKLKVPQGEGTRPTTDRIKETLFNILQGEILGCTFVDLFAGSGGIGIEALSRGARYAWFAENNREAVSCITKNLSFTKFADQATLLKGDVFNSLSLIREKEADIIFMDPPYGCGFEESLFTSLSRMPYVTENTLLILETQIKKELDFLERKGFTVIREKKYKTNKHVFIRRSGAAGESVCVERHAEQEHL